ncbi:MAG: efflux RND transporter periplasmic adaptor subunit, partial [Planctomycetota bacterium]
QNGAVLVRIDAAEIRARLAQAVAQRDQALRDLERYEELLRKQAVAQREYDSVSTQAEVARQAVREAEAMLAHATITAPFAGVITAKQADAGDLAMPGQGLLTLSDPDSLRLVVDMPEGMVAHIEEGDVLDVLVRETTIQAPVSEIAPTADPMSRTVQVKLDLPEHEALRIGRFVRVQVPIGVRESLRVPTAALLQRGQLDMVFTAEDGHARMRLVRLGRHEGEQISVLAGLSAGDRVLLDPSLLIVDGQPLADGTAAAEAPASGNTSP